MHVITSIIMNIKFAKITSEVYSLFYFRYGVSFTYIYLYIYIYIYIYIYVCVCNVCIAEGRKILAGASFNYFIYRYSMFSFFFLTSVCLFLFAF